MCYTSVPSLMMGQWGSEHVGTYVHSIIIIIITKCLHFVGLYSNHSWTLVPSRRKHWLRSKFRLTHSPRDTALIFQTTRILIHSVKNFKSRTNKYVTKTQFCCGFSIVQKWQTTPRNGWGCLQSHTPKIRCQAKTSVWLFISSRSVVRRKRGH